MWITIGLTLGAYINYFVVAPRLRVYTELAGDAITLPDFFKNRLNDKNNVLKIISGLIIVVFFTLYTHSGFVSGGKLFESAFGLDYHFGLILVAFIVIFYTFFGGYLAVSITVPLPRCHYVNCDGYGPYCCYDEFKRLGNVS